MDNKQPDQQAPDQSQPAPLDAQFAADLIRDKVSRIYAEEPDAVQELSKAENVPKKSKHQLFMHQLGNSGKDLATIQTAWHNYYQNLPPQEQHQVWQEFYASQATVIGQDLPRPAQTNPQAFSEHKQQLAGSTGRAKKAAAKSKRLKDIRNPQLVQKAIRDTVTASGKLETKDHIQSILFGLGMGMIVVVIFLFGFFNEVIIAPFVQPSRLAAATPLIVSDTSIAPTAQPEVIIPKINVEIPTDFSQTSTDESGIENALENGVVHYPTTALPGQLGNATFFGHSSNNIFNKGKYKFAFVLLHTVVPGDTFYLTYNSKVYVYKVISKTVVDPSNIGVLDPVPGQTATATLITCDPPGTSLKRLIVVGQQISPSPSSNTAAQPAATINGESTYLPGNGPTLFGRFSKTAAGKAVIIVILLAVFVVTIRWVNKPSRNRT